MHSILSCSYWEFWKSKTIVNDVCGACVHIKIIPLINEFLVYGMYLIIICNVFQNRWLFHGNYYIEIHCWNRRLNHDQKDIHTTSNEISLSVHAHDFYGFFVVPSIVVLIKMLIKIKCFGINEMRKKNLLNWKVLELNNSKSSSNSNPIFFYSNPHPPPISRTFVCRSCYCCCGWWCWPFYQMFWLTWTLFWININRINDGKWIETSRE